MILVPVGEFPAQLLAELSRRSGLASGPGIDAPQSAYHARRNQYDSTQLLCRLKQFQPGAVMGVTQLDLFIPVLRYVFGEAEMGGRAAIFSVCRLREEFYGLPPNPALLIERAMRELWHETGHLLGLAHCRDPLCVMSSSHAVEQVDTKNGSLCRDCQCRANVLSEERGIALP